MSNIEEHESMHEPLSFERLLSRHRGLDLDNVSAKDLPELKAHLRQIAQEVAVELIDVSTYLEEVNFDVPNEEPSSLNMGGHLLQNAGRRIVALTDHAGWVEFAIDRLTDSDKQ